MWLFFTDRVRAEKKKKTPKESVSGKGKVRERTAVEPSPLSEPLCEVRSTTQETRMIKLLTPTMHILEQWAV